MRREFEQMYLQWELEIALYDREMEKSRKLAADWIALANQSAKTFDAYTKLLVKPENGKWERYNHNTLK